MDAKITKISMFKGNGTFLCEACGSQKGLLFFKTSKVGQFALSHSILLTTYKCSEKIYTYLYCIKFPDLSSVLNSAPVGTFYSQSLI